MLEGALLAGIAIAGFGLGVLSRKGLEPWKIWFAAHRMKLRDKGKMPDYIEGVGETAQWFHTIHTFCRTPVRIGVTQKGDSVRYCWKCELILSKISGGGPGGRDDVPEDKSPKGVELSENVVVLETRRQTG